MPIRIPKKRSQTLIGHPLTAATEAVRLVLLPDAPNADGEARVGLLIPPAPAAMNRRPMLLSFANLAAALIAKTELEAAR